MSLTSFLKYGIFARNREECRIAGRFFPNGSSAISAATVVGYGFTVARTGVGIYVLTFEKPFPKFAHISIGMGDAALVNHIRVTAITETAAGITAVTLKNYTSAVSATAADIAAAATSWVSFDAVFIDTRTR